MDYSCMDYCCMDCSCMAQSCVSRGFRSAPLTMCAARFRMQTRARAPQRFSNYSQPKPLPSTGPL